MKVWICGYTYSCFFIHIKAKSQQFFSLIYSFFQDENQPNGPIPIDTPGNINIPKAHESNFLQEIYLSLRRQENRTEAFIKQVKKMNQKYWQKQHEQLCEFLSDEHERNIRCWENQKKSFDDGIRCVKDEVIQRFKQQDEYSGAILQCLQQVKSSVGELIQEKTERLKSENGILQHQKKSNQFRIESNKIIL